MTTEVRSTEKQMVLFELNEETYGLDIAAIREIIRMQEITRVPRAPAFVEGVINLRGKVVPVISLSTKLGLTRSKENKNNRIVVVDISGSTVGVIVDAVTEVVRISDSVIESTSEIVVAKSADFLRGIAKVSGKMVMLLDLERMLAKEQLMG